MLESMDVSKILFLSKASLTEIQLRIGSRLHEKIMREGSMRLLIAEDDRERRPDEY